MHRADARIGCVEELRIAEDHVGAAGAGAVAVEIADSDRLRRDPAPRHVTGGAAQRARRDRHAQYRRRDREVHDAASFAGRGDQDLAVAAALKIGGQQLRAQVALRRATDPLDVGLVHREIDGGVGQPRPSVDHVDPPGARLAVQTDGARRADDQVVGAVVVEVEAADRGAELVTAVDAVDLESLTRRRVVEVDGGGAVEDDVDGSDAVCDSRVGGGNTNHDRAAATVPLQIADRHRGQRRFRVEPGHRDVGRGGGEIDDRRVDGGAVVVLRERDRDLRVAARRQSHSVALPDAILEPAAL